jgi:hypothetical protein
VDDVARNLRTYFWGYVRSTRILHVLLAAVLLFIAGSAVFGDAVRERRVRVRGVALEGVIRSVEPRSILGLLPRWNLRIEVEHGGRRFEGTAAGEKKHESAYRVGRRLQVHFDPEDPEFMVLGHAEDSLFYMGLCAALFAGLWALLLGSSGWSARQAAILIRDGTGTTGLLEIVGRYCGFPLWSLRIEVDGRPVVGQGLIVPDFLAVPGIVEVVYDPKKPKRMAPVRWLGPGPGKDRP